MPHSKVAGATAYDGSIARQAPPSNLILPIALIRTCMSPKKALLSPSPLPICCLKTPHVRAATLLYGTEAGRLLQDNGKITSVATGDEHCLPIMSFWPPAQAPRRSPLPLVSMCRSKHPPGLIVHSSSMSSASEWPRHGAGTAHAPDGRRPGYRRQRFRRHQSRQQSTKAADETFRQGKSHAARRRRARTRAFTRSAIVRHCRRQLPDCRAVSMQRRASISPSCIPA